MPINVSSCMFNRKSNIFTDAAISQNSVKYKKALTVITIAKKSSREFTDLGSVLMIFVGKLKKQVGTGERSGVKCALPVQNICD
jgi:hypothetical protein